MTNRKTILRTMLLMLPLTSVTSPVAAKDKTVASPDGNLVVTLSDKGGIPSYSAALGKQTVLLPSRLGLVADFGDLTKGMTIVDDTSYVVEKHYDMTRTKKAHSDFKANATDVTFANDKGQRFTVTFVVADHDVALRYFIPRQKNDNPKCAIIRSEATSFRFPDGTTTFLSPQITPMTGWERTKPSYEEEYRADAPMTDRSQYGVGYTFPCLFHEQLPAPEVKGKKNAVVKQDYWVLVSETGVDGSYCGSRLSDYDTQTGYTIAYPQPGENNGNGSAQPGIALPGHTPWRTITVGQGLAPIVETTIPFDVVEPRYTTKHEYKPGRYTWSWLVWQDNSINYADQVQFIDLAAKYGYEYVLVDNWWDKNIGHKGMKKLAAYAKGKGVKLMLWYSSNGYWNDAPQTPRGIMNDAIARKHEMAWMERIGIAGIKVDFFGGDKQQTMQLYEDILSDAKDHHLAVIFHGCTLPRGWERMYPNYIASEAALASENVFFTEYHAKKEGFEMTMHPFCRNTVASFDWGGVIMNRYLSRDNRSRHPRYTSNTFELATAITNQTSVNCVEVTPQADSTVNAVERAFLKDIPTTWRDTKFIDGYPTRYAVIARQDAVSGKWFVGGLNGMNKSLQLTLSLPMLAGQQVTLLTDGKNREAVEKTVKIGKNGKLKVSFQSMGGIVIRQK